MFYVVAYDITDNRRRNKLFKIMNGYGIRNQFSLFECHLSEKRYKKMIEIIERIIKKEEDNIKIYYLCKDCFNMIKALGNCSVTQEENTIVI